MATTRVILLSILCCLATVANGQDETARLVASKVILNEQIAQDKDLTVLYSIFNIGDGAATSVEMVDGSFEESDFEHVAGQYQVMWDRIPAESNVTHAVVVRPKVYGVYNMSFARITYSANSDGKQVVGYTSAPGYTVIASYPEYARKYESHIFEWIAFVVMVAPTIGIPFLVWYQSQSKYEVLKHKKA